MAMIHTDYDIIDITSILYGLTISVETDAFITIKNEEPIDVSTLFPDENDKIIIHIDADCSLSLKSSKVRIIQNGLNLEIFRCKYFCNISQQFTQDVFTILKGHIIDKHNIMYLEPNTDDYKPAYYIPVGSDLGFHRYLVFDIEDTREKSTYAVKQLLDILPKELVDKIAFYLGCNKSKYEYKLTDFPDIFETKYKGEMPTYLSIHQLKKLYELGVLKIAVDYNYNLRMLTDESFDDNDYYNRLKRSFLSKEKMNQFIERFSSNFFKYVL
jgi:hypothetical protein